MDILKHLIGAPLGTALSIPTMAEVMQTRDRSKHRPRLGARDRNAAIRAAMDERFGPTGDPTTDAMRTWGGLGDAAGRSIDAMNQWGMSRGSAAPAPQDPNGIPLPRPKPAFEGPLPWWYEQAAKLGGDAQAPGTPEATHQAPVTEPGAVPEPAGGIPLPRPRPSAGPMGLPSDVGSRMPTAPNSPAGVYGRRGVELPRALPQSTQSFDVGSIPNFNAALPNMVDPTQLGDMSGLKARTVVDPDTGRAMNDFYREDLMSSIGALLKRATGGA